MNMCNLKVHLYSGARYSSKPENDGKDNDPDRTFVDHPTTVYLIPEGYFLPVQLNTREHTKTRSADRAIKFDAAH